MWSSSMPFYLWMCQLSHKCWILVWLVVTMALPSLIFQPLRLVLFFSIIVGTKVGMPQKFHQDPFVLISLICLWCFSKHLKLLFSKEKGNLWKFEAMNNSFMVVTLFSVYALGVGFGLPYITLVFSLFLTLIKKLNKITYNWQF